ncbi:hypothetical protein CsSME_00002997 [Camellia sinensis var. sinensis]
MQPVYFRSRGGKFAASLPLLPLLQCRNVVWLPGSIAEATVTTNVCSVCSPGPVFMIQFKFRRLEIPPNYNVDHLGCIGGCDEILKQLVEICGTGSRNLSTTPGVKLCNCLKVIHHPCMLLLC